MRDLIKSILFILCISAGMSVHWLVGVIVLIVCFATEIKFERE
jgi:ABC-type multidrug transport system permease subunit